MKPDLARRTHSLPVHIKLTIAIAGASIFVPTFGALVFIFVDLLVEPPIVPTVAAAAAMVWVTTALGKRLARQVTIPLAELTRYAQAIGEAENFDISPEGRNSKRNDEIGILARAINSMIARMDECKREMVAASEAEIRIQFGRLDTAINNMPQGLCMFDSDQRLIICNRRFGEMYGLAPDLTKPGASLRSILEHRVKNGTVLGDADYVEGRLALLAAAEPFFVTTELSDGRILAVSHQPMEGGHVGTHEDITERKKAEAEIAFMARHDALTSLSNRLSFREMLDSGLNLVSRGKTLAVLFIDLDHFKPVNDTFGHLAGDALLRAVSERIRASARPADHVARLGGDEFAIIQIDGDQPFAATQLASKIVKVLGEPFEISGHQVMIGASVGIAVAPGDGDCPDAILKNADLALYRAKENGRGSYRVFEPEMNAKVQSRRSLEAELRRAVESNQLENFYQPTVDLTTRQIRGFEVLLRWQHPERGLIEAEQFISLAEETGLLKTIGVRVIKDACKEAMNWPSHLSVAVNISLNEFRSGTLVLDVISALDESHLPPHRLVLEVRESALLRHTESTLVTLNQLRDLGVQIAIDDFGGGYSGLGCLQKSLCNTIKIDPSLTREMIRSPSSVAIVRAIADLGNALGVTTIAEGVETEGALQCLLDVGCTEVQGYVFSGPMSPNEIPTLLRSSWLKKSVA